MVRYMERYGKIYDPYDHHDHHPHHDHAPGGNGAGTGCKTKASTKQHIRQDLSDSIFGPKKIKNMIMMMSIEDMSIIEHHDINDYEEYFHDCNWLRPFLRKGCDPDQEAICIKL